MRAERSDEPIPLVDLICQFYMDRLKLLGSAEQANRDVTGSLPGWLRTAIRKENMLREKSDPISELPECAELIQLFPYAPSMDARAAQDVIRLMDALSDEPSVCIGSMGRMHLKFMGLPSAQRESWEDVAREHFQEVNRQWPYWLHFLEPTFKNYTYLTSLLCEPLARRQANGKILVLLNREDFYAEIIRLVMASLTLQEIWQIPIDRRRAHSLRVLEVLRECLVPA
ncbi:hypothetical protein GCM10027399_21890 [Curvibacter fontanus]